MHRLMAAVDPRLSRALEAQLEQWRAALGAGAVRVGWKLGMGDAERIGADPPTGHLTSASLLEPGGLYRGPPAGALHADAEVAVEMGEDVAPDADADTARRAIAAYGGALEIVDLADASHDAEAIVAANVFHRAVAFGPWHRELPSVEARLVVGGEVRAAAPAPLDLADAVRGAARVLGAVGERLRAGDRIITGSVVQVPIAPGDDVVADLGALGRVGLTIARDTVAG
jgi:2-keto-4-pentenoate hydratase